MPTIKFSKPYYILLVPFLRPSENLFYFPLQHDENCANLLIFQASIDAEKKLQWTNILGHFHSSLSDATNKER